MNYFQDDERMLPPPRPEDAKELVRSINEKFAKVGEHFDISCVKTSHMFVCLPQSMPLLSPLLFILLATGLGSS